ncbi:hypothetical protein DCAR_0728309 [Daucus carota subsp. sativus]|uniref:Uncharacterized protein n=1 Tax=Daucus carota subsp. sativus TaxID=79200 RepID=A0AAF1B8Q3_DAUCS|nr:PREDICTED: uncharacterized protein LOC108193967 [Daucus carota subsp. sativus]WOH08858.1 hypothetical protein DCAR_0728309 [Daucus carota subsp. sativus]
MAAIQILMACPKLQQLPLPLSQSQSHRPLRSFLLLQSPASSSSSSSSSKKKRLEIRCQAADVDADSSSQQIYQGFYGPWSVDSSDVREVILYRSGLVTAAASFVFAASTAFLPDHSFLTDLIKSNYDFLYALCAAGLGLSLFLIHIYVTEIKRTLQLFWGLGVLGSLATSFTLAEPAGQNLVQYVADHPTAVWLVGPLFAAFTGLVFKEGLCYGKLEAGILTFVVPAVLLGHLTGLMDDGLKISLLGLWTALFVIFAGRKFTQPIKDDIGDKSVFMFNSLPEEEKKLVVEKLEQRNYTDNLDKRE